MIRSTLATAAALAFLVCGRAFAAEEVKPRSIPTNLEMLEELARQVVEESAVKVPLDRGQIVLVRHLGDHEIGWIVENYLAGRLASLGASVYLDRGRPGSEAGEMKDSGEEKSRMPGGQDVSGAAGEGQDTGTGVPGEPDTTDVMPQDPGDSDTWPPKSFQPAVDDTLEGEEGTGGVSLEEAVKSSADLGKRPGEGETGATGDSGRSYSPYAETPAPDRILEFRVGELGVGYTRRWRKSLFGAAMVERSARAVIFFQLLDGKDGKVIWTDSGRLQRKDVVPQKLLTELEDTPGASGPGRVGGGGIGRVIEPLVVSGIVVGLVFLFYSSRT